MKHVPGAQVAGNDESLGGICPHTNDFATDARIGGGITFLVVSWRRKEKWEERAMNLEALLALPKEELTGAAEGLTAGTIADLADLLDEKADEARYQALLLLTARAERFPDVLPHWSRFVEKLSSGNSYQRSIGVQMLAANARWADEGAVQACLPACFRLLADEKPITARQAIQSLGKIARDAPSAAPEIARALMGMDILSARETMRKLLLVDACRALLSLKDVPALNDPVNAFLMSALSGDILDKAAKKQIRAAMNG